MLRNAASMQHAGAAAHAAWPWPDGHPNTRGQVTVPVTNRSTDSPAHPDRCSAGTGTATAVGFILGIRGRGASRERISNIVSALVGVSLE